MILIVGSKGVIAQSLRNVFCDTDIQIVGSKIAKTWVGENGKSQIKEYFSKLSTHPTVIINAAGVTNPSAPTELLNMVNYELPVNLFEYCAATNNKLLTLGTVMEELVGSCENNPYYASKRKYRDYIKIRQPNSPQICHVQLNTVYGGPLLQPHMFLGQIYKAIKNNEVFNMTDGEQWREYHHVDDDTKAIKLLVDRDYSGTIQINHGKPIQLRHLAKKVFLEFQKIDKLKIGSLSRPSIELYAPNSKRNSIFESIQFRDSENGIIDQFRRLLGKSE